MSSSGRRIWRFDSANARHAVAADADSEHARCAALALGLEDRVQHRPADPFEVSSGLQAGVGQLVLRADVLAAAALEDHPDLDAVGIPLLEVDERDPPAGPGSGVLSGHGVDRVRPQVAPVGRLTNRLDELIFQLPRAEAHRVMDPHDRGSGVLADRRGPLAGEIHVVQDGPESTLGQAAVGLRLPALHEGPFDVRRELGGSPPDQLNKGLDVISGSDHQHLLSAPPILLPPHRKHNAHMSRSLVHKLWG